MDSLLEHAVIWLEKNVGLVFKLFCMRDEEELGIWFSELITCLRT